MQIGDGKGAIFWDDPWLNGARPRDLAPLIYEACGNNSKTMSVASGLQNQAWARGINLNLGEAGLRQFLLLCDSIQGVTLGEEQDLFQWKWTGSGIFSAKSAYKAFFEGREEMAGVDLIWNLDAPAKCKFFIWLTCRNRCWTADRLERRGMDHPDNCPLCDQEPETISHLLLRCVVARQIWWKILCKWGAIQWLPDEHSTIAEWWEDIHLRGKARRSLATSVTLVLWVIWKHRNNIVFEGDSPNYTRVLSNVSAEGRVWRDAGLLGESFGSFPTVDHVDVARVG